MGRVEIRGTAREKWERGGVGCSTVDKQTPDRVFIRSVTIYVVSLPSTVCLGDVRWLVVELRMGYTAVSEAALFSAGLGTNYSHGLKMRYKLPNNTHDQTAISISR